MRDPRTAWRVLVGCQLAVVALVALAVLVIVVIGAAGLGPYAAAGLERAGR
jgi:hypothetical protein